MEKTINVINKMKVEGIIKDYAIGGGMACMFYMESILTYDLDIFCVVLGVGKLNILKDIYDWAKNKGYEGFKEHLIIEGIPVQFIVAYNELIREAIENAVEKYINDVKAKVVLPEYLIAIMLQTFRKKDIIKAKMMLEQVEINRQLLMGIVERYGLIERLRSIENYE